MEQPKKKCVMLTFEAWQKLSLLKIKLGMTTYSEVVEKLVDVFESSMAESAGE